MKNCPRHGLLLEQYKFCPFCGWPLDMDARRTDFELGRFEALSTVKEEITRWFRDRFNTYVSIVSIIGFTLTILGIFGINEMVTNRVDRAVHTEVDKEIGKVSDKLKKMIEIFPIMEFDFYRIKNIDFLPSVVLNNKKEIERISAWPLEIPVYDIKGNPTIRIQFPFVGLYSPYNIIFSKGVTGSGKIVSPENNVIDGKTIDVVSEANILEVNFDISIIGDNYDKNKESVKKIIQENIKSVTVLILVNNIDFHKHEIPVQENQCNYEEIRFEGTASSLKCNIKSEVSKIYKNTETVRTMYRTRLNSDIQPSK